MQNLRVTLWVYGIALRRAMECVRKNWVVSLAPAAYGVILTVIAALVAPLPFIGGLLYSLATSACISSGLYLIKNMVDTGKTDTNDFLNGFTAYIWDVITVGFILWIPLRLAAMGLSTVPNGALLYLCIQLALYILLNAVPELIYQSRVTGLELLSASYNFVVENWIEWLIPNIALALAGYWLLGVFGNFILGLPLLVQLFLHAFALGLCLTYFMTFRGFLFAELHGTTQRSRLYRYKARVG
jgi:hypothetical protein